MGPVILLLLACARPAPTALSDCEGAGRDDCLVTLAVTRIGADPELGIAALEAIGDRDLRMVAGGRILADRSVVFDFRTSTRVCAALHDSFDEAFCQRRLGQGHLRSP